MTTTKRTSPIVRIAKYTVLDEVRQRSFVVMFIVCALFVLLIRGCYHGNYMVNGQALDAQTVVTGVSKVAFHVISLLMMLITALISMRLFKRERDGGAQSFTLSKPITRRQYVLGKVAGLWVLSTCFMLFLQALVFLMAAATEKALMPGYLVASLLCSLNLLFVVLAMLLFSLLMPEAVAFLCVLGIGLAGLVIDGINALNSSSVVQIMTAWSDRGSHSNVSLWEILYYLWPKLSGMQHFASSFVGGGFPGLRSIYPLFSILFYCLILAGLLLRLFEREEIV